MADQNNRCSRCVHWEHGICKVTKERKNDSICTCGMFKDRRK